MDDKEQIHKELVQASIEANELNDKLREFYAPLISAMDQVQLGYLVPSSESVEEFERLNKEYEEANKKYQRLLRKYISLKADN